MKPPSGFEALRVGPVEAIARPAAVAWVRTTLESGATLHGAALARADGEPLRGRGPVPVISVEGEPGERWAVRHYYRGGALASLLEDLYLRVGRRRPFAEARQAEVAERRGVPTPAVVAGAVYPAGPFYRADLVTEYVPDSRDLAALLFGHRDDRGDRADRDDRDDGGRRDDGGGGWDRPGVRIEALEATAGLIVRAAEAGLYHPDVNAGNVLLARREAGLVSLLLDLDRCRVDVAGPARVEEAMVKRLERSLRKLGEASGRPLSEDEWKVFEHAVRTADPVAGP